MLAGFLANLNPLNHLSSGDYVSIWQILFATFLQGFWSRVFAVAALSLAFWLGVYRQRFVLGVLLFSTSVIITYFGGMIKAIFWWGL